MVLGPLAAMPAAILGIVAIAQPCYFVADAYYAARKIVIGVPFYGRKWTGVESTNNGLFQPIPPTAPPRFLHNFSIATPSS